MSGEDGLGCGGDTVAMVVERRRLRRVRIGGMRLNDDAMLDDNNNCFSISGSLANSDGP